MFGWKGRFSSRPKDNKAARTGGIKTGRPLARWPKSPTHFGEGGHREAAWS
ncbi:MAG: hypothetical protein P8Y36_03805 [Alphaproteobacteria bacterium]